jgi:tetratricopeptide (TPR) repeat protein
MRKRDWFRRESWTPEDEADFNTRIRRSRSDFHRCQYLAIQANVLRDLGSAALLPVAVALADRALSQHPDGMFLAGAHLVKANALADLGHHDDAIDSYRAAVQAQRAYPGVKHLTHLDFGDLAVGLRRAELYDEVEALFTDFGESDDMFPVNEFRHHYLLAVFAAARGASRVARDHARAALEATSKARTQFRYHSTVGLFRGASPDVLDELRRLAAV